ncbi:MAG: hypothetical protein COB17_04040 [Sulfurimonas sp.]|nr:MAG: hypothetical protein COB17_04040 [Sulfurimonas sp.]
MIIYLDISEFLRTRITTGIQRVVREYLQRAINKQNNINVIIYNASLSIYQLLDNKEVVLFLKDVQNYEFKTNKELDLFQNSKSTKVFFDMDSVWNASQKRFTLYKKLKNHNFKIVNFIYDLIPMLFPDFVKDNTKQNFQSFLDSVYKYSDLVFFDSKSALDDFDKLQPVYINRKNINKKVVYLGSDFSSLNLLQNPKLDLMSNNYKSLLSKKYILFVATLEPRKCQDQVLKAFEKLHISYPDLHLVLIGKVGWNIEKFAEILNKHPLKNSYIHHLDEVNDAELSFFYDRAFLVTYLSIYEGYGLPVVESLKHSNITIVLDNSSMKEVGTDCADYILDKDENKLVDIISKYLDNPSIYNKRIKYIKSNYKAPIWDNFYTNISNTLSYTVIK